MSYILDALRKSEEDRQKRRTRAAGSGFTFVKDTTPPKKKFTFGLILTGCMLLAAIIPCSRAGTSARPTHSFQPFEPSEGAFSPVPGGHSIGPIRPIYQSDQAGKPRAACEA
jgi:hypothetical protein